MAMVMATAMVMISSNQKLPSTPPNQDEAHTMTRDFIEIIVSNSVNDRQLVQVASGRLDARMPDIPELEIWTMMLHWMFLLSPYLPITSLLLWISAQYKWRRHRFLPPPEISQVEVEIPCAPDPPNGDHIVLIGCGTSGFVCLRTLNSRLIVSFLLLNRFPQPRGSEPKEGDHVTARLHVMCPGPGTTRVI